MLEGEEHNCGKGILGKTAGKALQWPRFNLEEVGVVFGGGGLSIRRASSRQVVAHCRTSSSSSASASLQDLSVPLPDLGTGLLPDHSFVSSCPSLFSI